MSAFEKSNRVDMVWGLTFQIWVEGCGKKSAAGLWYGLLVAAEVLLYSSKSFRVDAVCFLEGCRAFLGEMRGEVRVGHSGLQCKRSDAFGLQLPRQSDREQRIRRLGAGVCKPWMILGTVLCTQARLGQHYTSRSTYVVLSRQAPNCTHIPGQILERNPAQLVSCRCSVYNRGRRGRCPEQWQQSGREHKVRKVVNPKLTLNALLRRFPRRCHDARVVEQHINDFGLGSNLGRRGPD